MHLKPPITTTQLYLLTSYPLGAYFNATMNPIFLYWRILKTKLSCFHIRTQKTVVSSHASQAIKFKTKVVERKVSEVSGESARVQGINIKFMSASRINMSKQIVRACSRASSVSSFGKTFLMRNFGGSKERVQVLDPLQSARQSSVVIDTQTGKSLAREVYNTIESQPSNSQTFHAPQTQMFTVTNFVVPQNKPSAPSSLQTPTSSNFNNNDAFVVKSIVPNKHLSPVSLQTPTTSNFNNNDGFVVKSIVPNKLFTAKSLTAALNNDYPSSNPKSDNPEGFEVKPMTALNPCVISNFNHG